MPQFPVDRATTQTMIPQTDLVPGEWYEGQGRLGPLAVWTGEDFVAVSYSLGRWGTDHMVYGSKGFSPLRLYRFEQAGDQDR